MNKKIVAGSVVLALFAGSIYAAPYWTVYKMRKAIIDNDAASFSERVDFPALRENLKAQFTARMMEQMGTSQAQSNPFAALGSALAVGLVNRIVETMVTPGGVMMMLDRARTQPLTAKGNTGQEAAAPTSPANPESPTSPEEKKKPAEYALTYQDWSTVRAQPKTADAGAGAFIFKRDGLWSWKLAGIALPAK